MRHERATEEIRELAALYALGSLTQHEARSFEIHMQEGCSVCEAELRTFENVVAGIGFAAEEAAAPEYLRDLLLARIEREGRTAPAAPAPSVEIDAKELPQAKPQPRSAPRPIFNQPGQQRPSSFSWMLAAILAVLALLALYAWKSSKDANAQLAAKLSASQADADDLRTLLAIQRERNGEFEQIMSILGKPGTRVLVLAGQPVTPSLSGAIFWDTERNLCLTIGNFPPAPEGKIYELWFVTPAAKTPAGSLKPNPTGRVFAALNVPLEITNLAGAIVTLEPDNGSQIPTIPFCAIGRFN
jgi:anti-sigma-K factor RskA